MERSFVLPKDMFDLIAYCHLWSVEIGEPVEECCGFLVFETEPDVRDELLRELPGVVI